MYRKKAEWKKVNTLVWTISGLSEEKVSINRKIKVRYLPGARIKDMYS